MFGCVQVEMESSEAPIYIVPDYVPEYRSGGCAERGIRRSMEDAHVCVDNLEETLGTRGAFYGVNICVINVNYILTMKAL